MLDGSVTIRSGRFSPKAVSLMRELNNTESATIVEIVSRGNFLEIE